MEDNLSVIQINKELSLYEINRVIEEMEGSFDYILIDLSENLEISKQKMLFEKANKIIVLIEPNHLEISKINQKIDIFIYDYKINIGKIYILFKTQNS